MVDQATHLPAAGDGAAAHGFVDPWLGDTERILAHAEDSSTELTERIAAASSVARHLDAFFMLRAEPLGTHPSPERTSGFHSLLRSARSRNETLPCSSGTCFLTSRFGGGACAAGMSCLAPSAGCCRTSSCLRSFRW